MKTKVKTDHLTSSSMYDLADRIEAVLELHLNSGHSIIGTHIISDPMNVHTRFKDWAFDGYIFYTTNPT